MKRINRYLDTKEIDPLKMVKNIPSESQDSKDNPYAIQINNQSFSWGIKKEEKKEDETKKKKKKKAKK